MLTQVRSRQVKVSNMLRSETLFSPSSRIRSGDLLVSMQDTKASQSFSLCVIVVRAYMIPAALSHAFSKSIRCYATSEISMLKDDHLYHLTKSLSTESANAHSFSREILPSWAARRITCSFRQPLRGGAWKSEPASVAQPQYRHIPIPLL